MTLQVAALARHKRLPFFKIFTTTIISINTVAIFLQTLSSELAELRLVMVPLLVSKHQHLPQVTEPCDKVAYANFLTFVVKLSLDYICHFLGHQYPLECFTVP